MQFEGNPGFSCANVGATTSCCTPSNFGRDTSACYQGVSASVHGRRAFLASRPALSHRRAHCSASLRLR